MSFLVFRLRTFLYGKDLCCGRSETGGVRVAGSSAILESPFLGRRKEWGEGEPEGVILEPAGVAAAGLLWM